MFINLTIESQYIVPMVHRRAAVRTGRKVRIRVVCGRSRRFGGRVQAPQARPSARLRWVGGRQTRARARKPVEGRLPVTAAVPVEHGSVR